MVIILDKYLYLLEKKNELNILVKLVIYIGKISLLTGDSYKTELSS